MGAADDEGRETTMDDFKRQITGQLPYQQHFTNRNDLINWYEGVTTETGLYPEGGTGSLIAINYCMLGLGEAGECQGKLKKVWRGDKTLDEQRAAIIDELGDTLWYLTRASIELGVGLAGLIEHNAAKVLDRKARGQIRGEGDNR